MSIRLRKVYGVMLFFLLWCIVSLTTDNLADPATVVITLWKLGLSEIAQNSLSTLAYVFLGLGIATLLGTSLGLLIGFFPTIHDFSEFSLDFTRSIPVTALFPFIILVVGIAESRLMMIVLACIFPILLNTIRGVESSERNRSDVASVFGARNWQIFFHIKLYEALPFIFVGIHISIGVALVVAVLVEYYIGANSGLGVLLWSAYSFNDSDQVTALIVVVGICGYLINVFFNAIQRRYFSWMHYLET